MPKFVFLWTDLVLWLVVAALASSTSVHVAAQRAICARPGATCCTTRRRCARPSVLVVFIAHRAARFDALPPRAGGGAGQRADATVAYDTRTLSLLDVLLHGAIEAREKTYSVPLAYWSFQREHGSRRRHARCARIRGWPMAARTWQTPRRDWKPDVLDAVAARRGWSACCWRWR